MKDKISVMIPEEELMKRVRELGEQISRKKMTNTARITMTSMCM